MAKLHVRSVRMLLGLTVVAVLAFTALRGVSAQTPSAPDRPATTSKLMVTIGDSVASGEGNPDVEGLGGHWGATAEDQRCHRNTRWNFSKQAVDLLQTQGQSWDLKNFACSG